MYMNLYHLNKSNLINPQLS